jgi:uncharacterized protein YdiU (UPF0061 family)
MPYFDNTFSTLGPFFFERVRPTPLHLPRLIHSTDLRHKMNLDLSDDKMVSWLNGEISISGDQRISTRYAGHQFGVWAGQLGDGRAISLGEIIQAGDRYEIQTKGSGLTPFSRMGDGKAVIRSSVREYLCSLAMVGLNIPTTRVLALLTGEDAVYREVVERSALVARVFPSNLRFGHFEMYYQFNRPEELKILIDYTRKTFFNDSSIEDMLTQIVKRTAHLLANWQSVGFCHGVMNTDNMSVLGLTIDYGPFGFLEDTDLNYICNHSDHEGRYAYNQQPSIGLWNLERFLICFIDHVKKEDLLKILNEYPQAFQAEYLRLSRLKMGLISEDVNDHQLFVDCLKTLSKLSIDYTFFWRQLSEFKIQTKEGLEEIVNNYGHRPELYDWIEVYAQRLLKENSSDQQRAILMKKNNPKYILRNYIAQEVIEDVEKGDSEKLKKWIHIFESPYDEHPDDESYSRPTPSLHKNIIVSCSS